MAPIPTDDEVSEVYELVQENISAGTSAYPGMTYEEGVEHAIRWMQGDEPSSPMSDEE